MFNATTSSSTVLVLRPRFVIEGMFFCGHGHAQAVAVMVFRQSGVKQLGEEFAIFGPRQGQVQRRRALRCLAVAQGHKRGIDAPDVRRRVRAPCMEIQTDSEDSMFPNPLKVQIPS